MRKQMIAAAVSTALGLGIASVAQADIININPQGAGGTLAVGALDWLPANAISLPTATGTVVPTPAGTIQVYGHGRLGVFADGGGDPLALASPYEWTYVFGFQELAVPLGPLNSNFFATAGGNNFFRVFYDAVADSNNLEGTGFNNGTLILEGTIRPFDGVSGSGTFAAVALGQQFDQFLSGSATQPAGNNYPGITSTTGTGSSDFTADVTFSDPNFFPDGADALRVITDTFQNQPFQQVNPSSCFFDGTALIGGAGPGNHGSACANSIGAVNGVSGPNVMFQTDATSVFQSVPEPGSLALMALGLLSLLGFSRKKLS